MIQIKNIKNIKKILKPKYLLSAVINFFGRYARSFIFLVAIVLLGFCIDLWYDTIYRPQWDENQKQIYIKNKGHGTVFNEKGFEFDVAVSLSRNEESQRKLDNLVDIFRLKKSAVPAETPAIEDVAPTPAPAANQDSFSAGPTNF